MICLLAFSVVGLIYRKELNQRREECRRLVTTLLESHLGEPQSRLRNGETKEQEAVALRGGITADLPVAVKLPEAP